MPEAFMYSRELGTVPVKVWKIHNWCQQYDDRLTYRMNDETGQWCVFLKMPRPAQDMPLFGQNQPNLPDVMEHIQRTDSWNYAKDLLDRVNKDNKRHEDQMAKKMIDPVGEGAEKIFWATRGTRTRKFS
jgi:hypothetical protein